MDCSCYFAGLSSDSTFHTDLHSRRRSQAHHAICPEPSAASVRPEKLRVQLPHPGRDAQRDGTALQQLQHPMPENHGEYTHSLTGIFREFSTSGLSSEEKCETVANAQTFDTQRTLI